ncbi:hypothetical protein Salat_1641200 [Sesamum alatum]|uniref:Uncharacterized protein n=1 Tax=Sesamum alatum TaxID=300844 RepID=A0AAE1Y699_9LAMI|nr:hypothetical protein Salat_1641200 [Sesamum alatum]
MSEKERRRAGKGSGGGGGGGSGGADEENGEGPSETGDKEEKKGKGSGKNGKRASLFRLRKNKKVLHRRRKQKGIPVNSCCFGLRKPRTLSSSGESPTSDPNSPTFTSDMLRTLIEKNDFYSKEYNPNLDVELDG